MQRVALLLPKANAVACGVAERFLRGELPSTGALLYSPGTRLPSDRKCVGSGLAAALASHAEAQAKEPRAYCFIAELLEVEACLSQKAIG